MRHLRRRRSPLILLLLIALWCVVMGVGLSQATGAQAIAPKQASTTIDPMPGGTVDPVAPRHELGQSLYFETCATCHLALPPQIMPTDTWGKLLQDPQHYGVRITPPVDPGRLLIWNYLQAYSRPALLDEQIPYRIGDSRYFRALHPRVDLPRRIQVDSCATCHPAAFQYNFRQLAPNWETAP